MKVIWIAALSAGLLQLASAANILALIPFPSKSHAIFVESLIQGLDAKGHSITLITVGQPQTSLGKTKVMLISNLREWMGKNMRGLSGSGNMFEMRHMTPLDQILRIPKVGFAICEFLLENEEVQDLIHKSKEKFDLVVGEVSLDESILAGFAHRFQAPLVVLHTFMPNIWCNYLVGNPAPAAFIPDPFLGYSNHMTFLERVTNFVFGTFGEFYHTNFYLPKQDALMRKYFTNDMPPIHEILKNTSLVLVNHHYSIGFPRPYVPNMIEVSAMHIKDPKPLPDELKSYMDGSKDGVVLFSMGSNLQSAHLAPELIQGILRAFGRLKQNVLWKFEAELENLPKNVRIMKWLPQSDILAHPNLKLFITHGGLMSTTEAVHRGVPVVGIPIFGDQPVNMRHTENAGLGKTLNFDDINEETLYGAVTEVLNNSKYRENAKEKSELLKDTPKPPLENAIWWVDYIIRHKGAPHLRSAAQDLAWYEYYLLDVYTISAAFIFIGAVINIRIFKAVIRRICSKECCKKSTKSSDEREKDEKKTK